MATVASKTSEIDQRYKENIAEATANLQDFWSRRNVQKLTGFYRLWARDLTLHQMDPLRAIHKLFDTLNDLFETDPHGLCPIQEKRGRGTDALLMTKQELMSEAASLKATLIHQTALEVFTHKGQASDEHHPKRIQYSYKFLNDSEDRFIERSIHFGELTPLDLDAIEKLDLEILELLNGVLFSSLFGRGIRELLRKADKDLPQEDWPDGVHPTVTQILNFLKSKQLNHPAVDTLNKIVLSQPFSGDLSQKILAFMVKIEHHLPNISEVKRLFENKIKILRSKSLSCLSQHLDWVRNLEFLRLEASNRLSSTKTGSQSERHFQKYITLLNAEENRVHSLAHQESLAALETLAPLTSVVRADLSALFHSPLQGQKTLLFEVDLNKFIFTDTVRHIPDESEVAFCIEQIQKVIYLIAHNNAEIIHRIKMFFSEGFTPAKAIKHLLKMIDLIEKTRYQANKKKPKPQLAEKIDSEVQALIISQIKGAFDLAKEKSKLENLHVSSLFKAGSAPHFYLKLASDLAILPNLASIDVHVDMIAGLVAEVNKTNDWVDKEGFLDDSAREEGQIAALKNYKAIREINRKVTKNPMLKVSYETQHALHAEEFKSQLTENAAEMLLYLASIKSEGANEAELRDADQIFDSISVEKINSKFPGALFYFDLALRLPRHDFTFELGERTIELNPLQKAVLEKIILYYRLYIQKAILSTQNLTPLYQVVPVQESDIAEMKLFAPLAADQEVLSEIKARSSVKKLKDKFIEIFLHGLRNYHSSFATLTTYLDRDEEHLKEEFVNLLLKKKMMKDKKMKKAPTPLAVKKYKSGLETVPEALEREAKVLQLEFCGLLTYYRAIQSEIYKFYSALGNILFKEQHLLDLPPLTVEDIDYLERNIDSVKVGFFNNMDQEVATHLKPHLSKLRALIEKIPPKERAQAFFSHVEPLKDVSGTPLIFKEVSYINLKLLIRTIRLVEKGRKIKGINVAELQKVFTAPNSLWSQYAKQVQRATSAGIETALGAFIKKHDFEKMRFFTAQPHSKPTESLLPASKVSDKPDPWEYFGFAPVITKLAFNAVFSKWNAYKEDLRKRVRGEIVDECIQAIEGASSAMNKDLHVRESMKAKKNTTIL